MAGELPGDPSHEMIRDGACSPGEYGFSWYLSRKEIENNSPSRKDGIDQRKESRLRMLYCSFLQDIGMKLVVPQVTIATATMFCHRFYLHQSHAKNEWQTIATVCMFLASKVEETPRPLDKVIVVAYTMMYRKDSAAARRIYRKDIFEKQKALIVIGERLLLSTIRFDFNIQHPYKPLVEACKKFGCTQKEVMRVAWNFVNDWLRTTLCLQYKSHYIAAGSLFLAAKLQNVKLPSERGSIWWHAFDVAPRQLEEVIQHMMELLGYKNGGVVKPSHPPLSVKKEAIPSSLDCVPSRPASSGGSPRHESDGEVCKSRVKDSAICNSTCSWKQDNESPNSVVEDGERPGSAEPDRATDGAGKIDIDRIKAMIKRRKQEMEDNKLKGGIGDSGEEAWIERELESGIELGFEPPSEKRQRSA